MRQFGLWIAVLAAGTMPAAVRSESNPLFFRETLQQLTQEHVECAMFYLASSLCLKPAPAAEARQGFELMMQRAYQLGAESGIERVEVSARAERMLEDMNRQMGGDCGKLPALAGRYKSCQALKDDFTARGRDILHKRLGPHR